MLFKYLTPIVIALCYILIGFDQQVSAQQCQQDAGSAYLNTAFRVYQSFIQDQQYGCEDQDHFACGTNCAGPLSTTCCNGYVCICTDSGFPCSETYDPVDVFVFKMRNTCTSEVFYYGEYVLPDYQYTGADSALFSVRDANFPNAAGSVYTGNGVVQMGDKSKYYVFYHRMSENPSQFLGTYSDASCYIRKAFAKLDNDVIGDNSLQNFGSAQAPSIGTCPAETSCPLGDCSYIAGATKCCFDGTCICTKDTSICGDSSKVLMATSTNACQKNPSELFYYGELTTAFPIANDGLFYSAIISQGNFWLFTGTGVIDMTNQTGTFRKDIFFLHKYPM